MIDDRLVFRQRLKPLQLGGHGGKTALGVLNVYSGRTVVWFPVAVKSGATMEDVKIKGKVRFQVCDDNVCYPPVKPPFEIDTSIVPEGQAVHDNEPELFDTRK